LPVSVCGLVIIHRVIIAEARGRGDGAAVESWNSAEVGRQLAGWAV